MPATPPALDAWITLLTATPDWGTPGARLVFLTGAGISAESGVPTFRGPEGYWRVGSRNYQPMELATHDAFTRMPDEIWRWYLYRRSVCRAASPNVAHLALAAAESHLGDGVLLVTQNVDGLHLRAGSSLPRTYQIHGNIDFARCTNPACPDGPSPRPLPPELVLDRAHALPPAFQRQLTCACGARLRPHVLWFDESYDEPLFRYASTLAAIDRAAGLVVIGTSGATSLPARMCEIAAARDLPWLVIDPEPTTFARAAEASRNGRFLAGTASALVPLLVEALGRARVPRPSPG